MVRLLELPQHQCTISRPFLIGTTEITVGQFRKFVAASGYVTEAEQYGFGNSGDKVISDTVKEDDKGKNWKNPGYAVTDDCPVTQITWNDAVAYCAWLSEQEQRRSWYRTDGKSNWLIAAEADGYRLPTEAEWEYACRAGTTSQFHTGDDKSVLQQYEWFSKNAEGKAQPVALKRSNPFGLYDIAGNAREWCQDIFNSKAYERHSPNDPINTSVGPSRVMRGGGWSNVATLCRGMCRSPHATSYRGDTHGFRIMRPW